MPLAPAAADESTPLVRDMRPSYTLGMTRARLRLIRNPETDDLFGFMGLCAPHSAFELLGQGSATHVKILGYCFYVGVLSCVFGLPLLLTTFGRLHGAYEGQLRSEVNNSLIIVKFFHKIQNFRQISDLFSQI